MDYNTLRHWADSWGLVMLCVLAVLCIGWALRPGRQASKNFRDAANSIFEEDRDNG